MIVAHCAALAAAVVCLPAAAWLAVLSLRDARGLRRTAVVLPDALDPDAFRRLRMWLRWRPPGTAQQIVKANDPTRR